MDLKHLKDENYTVTYRYSKMEKKNSDFVRQN